VSHLLVIEDDEGILDSLAYKLREAGHSVLTARDGSSGLRMARTGNPDLVLLDLMLPGTDGIEVCRSLRRTSRVPIIILTARDSEVDKVLGLELGADDYITKPFSMRELLARVSAVTRRTRLESTPAPVAERETIGGFTLDRAAQRVLVDGVEVKLTSREFRLLSHLLLHAGRVQSREALLRDVWGPGFDGDRKTVDVHVRWLREKFAERSEFAIVTVRGSGYRLDREPAAAPAS
jgi:DNA-binding response OmpR family regulator